MTAADMTVQVYLTVTHPGNHYPAYGGTLYVRDIVMHHTPHERDSIHLWETDDDGGPLWAVFRRYWGANGRLRLELSTMQVDPPEGGQHHAPYAMTWWTDQDGDPNPKLLAAGWRLYGED